VVRAHRLTLLLTVLAVVTFWAMGNLARAYVPLVVETPRSSVVTWSVDVGSERVWFYWLTRRHHWRC